MPKSNSVTRALGAVTRAVQEGGLVEVPDHLRGSNYRGASEQGFGTDYQYPHDYRRRLGRPAVPSGRAGRTALLRPE